MPRKRERPPITFRKTARGPVPVSAYDAEEWDAVPIGTEFDMAIRAKRSWPQLKLFWSVLTKVVAATGCAPNKDRLCDILKHDLGYVTPVRMFDGTRQYWPDSIALEEMEPDDFQAFFESSMAYLAERTGIDPMALINEAEEAA